MYAPGAGVPDVVSVNLCIIIILIIIIIIITIIMIIILVNFLINMQKLQITSEIRKLNITEELVFCTI